MTIYDFLKLHEPALRKFHRNGIATDSTKYLPLYSDYLQMADQGHKKMYIIAHLADKYGYKERWVRAVVKFMQEEVI